MRVTIEFPRGTFQIIRNLNTAEIEVLVERIMDYADRWNVMIKYEIEMD